MSGEAWYACSEDFASSINFGNPMLAPQGYLALPKHEFALDVLAFDNRRYSHHSSGSETHLALVERGVAVTPRTVTNLLERYDELVTLSLRTRLVFGA
jgi:hypothetical protein